MSQSLSGGKMIEQEQARGFGLQWRLKEKEENDG
jgi:hypothetical protein